MSFSFSADVRNFFIDPTYLSLTSYMATSYGRSIPSSRDAIRMSTVCPITSGVSGRPAALIASGS